MSYYSKIVSIIEKVDENVNGPTATTTAYIEKGGVGAGTPAGSNASEFVMVSEQGEGGKSEQVFSVTSPFLENKEKGIISVAVASTDSPNTADLLSMPKAEALSLVPAANAQRYRAMLRDFYNIDQTRLTKEQKQALIDEDEDAFVIASEAGDLATRVEDQEKKRCAALLTLEQRTENSKQEEHLMNDNPPPRPSLTSTAECDKVSAAPPMTDQPKRSIVETTSSFFGLGLGSSRSVTVNASRSPASTSPAATVLRVGGGDLLRAPNFKPFVERLEAAVKCMERQSGADNNNSMAYSVKGTSSDRKKEEELVEGAVADGTTILSRPSSVQIIRSLAGQLGEALARIEVGAREAEERQAYLAILEERVQRRDDLLERLRLVFTADELARAEADVLKAPRGGRDDYAEAKGELATHQELSRNVEPIQRLQAMLTTRAETIETLEQSSATLRAQLKQEEATREEELAALRAQVESSAFESLKFTEIFEESARRKAELGRLSRKISGLQQLLDERSAECEGLKSQAEALQQLLSRRRRRGEASGGVEAGPQQLTHRNESAVINVGGEGEGNFEGGGDYYYEDESHLSGLTNRQIRESKVYRKLGDVKFGTKLQKGITTVDSAAVSVGRFLRRYALARLFAAVYIVVIHFYLFAAVFSGLHSLPVDGHDVHDHISNHIDHKHIVSPDESN